MRYNIGDTVFIKEDHSNENCGKHGCMFMNDRMRRQLGKKAVVVSIKEDEIQLGYTLTFLDKVSQWHWSDCMIAHGISLEDRKKAARGGECVEKPFIIKPTTKVTKIPYKQFKLGIELETLVPDDSMSTINRMSVDNVEYTDDGSIDDESNTEGVEFKTEGALSYTDLTKTVKELCTVLDNNDVYINTSCGFHLHVSNKRFFTAAMIDRIILTWSAIEDFLLATQPRSRLNNTYCRRYLLQYVNDQKDGKKLSKRKHELIEQLDIDRYKTLNLSALSKHGTIEIRLHAGTTQATKILAWTDLMLAFFTYCLKDYNRREVIALFNQKISDEKIQNILTMLNIPDKQQIYFKGRVHKFLFERLAKQQESAGKIIKNIKKIRTAKVNLDKARKNYDDIDQSYRQEYRQLEG